MMSGTPRWCRVVKQRASAVEATRAGCRAITGGRIALGLFTLQYHSPRQGWSPQALGESRPPNPRGKPCLGLCLPVVIIAPSKLFNKATVIILIIILIETFTFQHFLNVNSEKGPPYERHTLCDCTAQQVGFT